MKHAFSLLAAAIIVITARPLTTLASQHDPATIAAINAHLQRFAANPKQVMNDAPERWDAQGRAVSDDSPFSPQAIQSGAALAARDAERVIQLTAGLREGIQANDRPQNLVDGGAITMPTLESLEANGLTQASLSQQPWSDDYWGVYKGILGARYADPDFPANQGNIGLDWRNNHDYAVSHPASQIVASGDPDAIDALSPSEKYELLIGDEKGTLTKRMWQTGQRYENTTGQVETWRGICNGWSPAAFMLPRPEQTVSLMAADGQRQIAFYPSDAKALASLLWANGRTSIKYIGGRCNDLNPAEDANGRVISQKCFDTNPATWHLAVTHQIGLARRSFVLDATYDYQVWNQPALGYSYSYFNPQTGYYADDLTSARVPMGEFTADKFRAYRSKNAASVVGITMDFTYVHETLPSHEGSDSASQDSLRTVRYFYDLELDARGNVIGGEWYANLHPDFLWVPKPGTHARSTAENQASGSWSGAGIVPNSWRKAALSAENQGQPLGKLVETLLNLASGTY